MTERTATDEHSSNAAQIHTIVGAGAVGSGTALILADRGYEVRVITRSGTGPDHRRIRCIAADASDPVALAQAAAGSAALYNCANPQYHQWAADWPPLAASFIAAAEQTGARLVTMSNLYGFARGASPMAALDPLDPPSKKGAIRAQMWADTLAAHEAGRIQATEARASDYFGPGIGDTAHLGDRVIPRAMAGKNVSTAGATDIPHSWSYIDDVCETLAILGTDARAVGRAWHVPTAAPKTATQMVHAVCAEAGSAPVKVKPLPRLLMKVLGLFIPFLREVPEILYQFDEPFIIDATDTTETFGLEHTPLADQIKATVASY